MTALRNLIATACLCAVGIAPALAQGTTFTNGTFNAGDLTGWQSFGDVKAVNGHVRATTASVLYDDDNLGAGKEGFMNESGIGAVDFFDSSALAGIPVANFDLNGDFAYEGSAIRQNFTAFGGSALTVKFDWAFLSADTAKPDFGFLAINNDVFKIVDTTSGERSGNFLGTSEDTATNVSWSWYQTSFTYQATGDGAVSLALGVVDMGDTQFTSQMRFDNVSVSAVPEPETYALMLAGLGVIGGCIRRRQQRADAKSV